MSLLVSAQTGETYSVEKLMGEEEHNDVAARESQAEKDLRKLKRRMKKAGIK